MNDLIDDPKACKKMLFKLHHNSWQDLAVVSSGAEITRLELSDVNDSSF